MVLCSFFRGRYDTVAYKLWKVMMHFQYVQPLLVSRTNVALSTARMLRKQDMGAEPMANVIHDQERLGWIW